PLMGPALRCSLRDASWQLVDGSYSIDLGLGTSKPISRAWLRQARMALASLTARERQASSRQPMPRGEVPMPEAAPAPVAPIARCCLGTWASRAGAADVSVQ